MFQKSGGEKRVDLGKFIYATLKRNNKIAEMIVDPEKAWRARHFIDEERKKRKDRGNEKDLTIDELKSMPEIDINDVFEGFTIFEDHKRGDVYPESFLEEMFGTTDTTEIAYQFLLDSDAEFHWTKEQRDTLIEKKRKQIISIISRNAINPQTKKPHPPQRIEKAILEAKYSISNKSAEEQVKDVVSAISSILPIRMENVELAVKIPASFAAKSYGTIEKYGRIKQSEWQNDGSWVGILDMPAGLEAEFLEKINNLTHGRAQIKTLKRT